MRSLILHLLKYVRNPACAAVNAVVKNATINEFLSLSGSDQRAYFDYLRHAQLNDSDASERKQSPAEFCTLKGLALVHQYFQLPCTFETRQKRVDWMAAQGWQSKKILLLGDDDLVAVELAHRNFPETWVVDLDVNVLRTIDLHTRELERPPRTCFGDLANAKFAAPCRADVVCIDPPYNSQWLQIFADAAVAAVADQKAASIVLMFNPRCVAKVEFQKILESLRQQGFHQVEHHSYFNKYPINWLARSLLWSIWVIWPNGRPKPRLSKIKFYSDLFHFRRG
jgi:hypothetical protein